MLLEVDLSLTFVWLCKLRMKRARISSFVGSWVCLWKQKKKYFPLFIVSDGDMMGVSLQECVTSHAFTSQKQEDFKIRRSEVKPSFHCKKEFWKSMLVCKCSWTVAAVANWAAFIVISGFSGPFSNSFFKSIYVVIFFLILSEPLRDLNSSPSKVEPD